MAKKKKQHRHPKTQQEYEAKYGPPPVIAHHGKSEFEGASPLPGWGVGPGIHSATVWIGATGNQPGYMADYSVYNRKPPIYLSPNLTSIPHSTSKKAPPTSKTTPPPKGGKAPTTSKTTPTPTPKPKGGKVDPKGGKVDPKSDRAKVIEQAMGAHRTANPISYLTTQLYSDPYKDMTMEQLSHHFEDRDRKLRMQSLFNDAQIGRIPSGVNQQTGQGGRSIHSSPGPDMLGNQSSTLHPLKDDPKGQFQAAVGFIAETAAFGGAASLVARIPWARIFTRKDSPRAGDPYWGSQAKDSARARAAAAREKTKLERPVSDKKKTPKPGPTVKGKPKGKPDDRPGKTKPGESSTKPLPETKGTRAQRKKQREQMLRDKDKKKKKKKK